MNKYKIALVDDHKLFREGLKLLLSNLDYVEDVYEASNGKEFLELMEKIPCDIVLMDIEMPVMNGIEATEKAVEIYPDLKIIALSMYGEEIYYYKMVEAGAKGFLLKDSGMENVQEAIETVCDGSSYFSEELLFNILQNMRTNKKIEEITGDLSDRELEILCHVCKGLSNQEIADELCISKRTVDKHRGNLLAKTQSKNTASLVMFAIKNKLIEI
ncbi:MAG: response regulator transcription factor [Marinifilaceae bacterium]